MRPDGLVLAEYKFTTVRPAEADWDGPLYFVAKTLKGVTKRAGTKVFVAIRGYALNRDLEGAVNGQVVYLADGGKMALTGVRPVGTVLSVDHPEKSTVVLLDPGQCGAREVKLEDIAALWTEIRAVRKEAADDRYKAELAQKRSAPAPKKSKAKAKKSEE